MNKLIAYKIYKIKNVTRGSLLEWYCKWVNYLLKARVTKAS